MEQIKKEVSSKAHILLNVICYLSIISIILGIAIAIISFMDNQGWNGIYLGLGI